MSRVVRKLTIAFVWLACCSCLPRIGLAAAAEELTVQARLVWGSNDQKPKEASYKEVDPKLAETLRRVLKWKNYYECNRTNLSVALNQTKKVKISAKCELEITYLGQSRAETKLFGKGEVVDKRVQQISHEPLILGGPDKNDTAWFVVISKVKQ